MNKITIDTEIGGFGVTAKGFKAELEQLEGDIHIEISSFGGSVSDAVTIHNLLKSYNKGKVTAKYFGDSASAATIIASGADRIEAASNIFLLYHKVWGTVSGNSDELQDLAEEMLRVEGTVKDIYNERFSSKTETIEQLLSREDWITAEEARDMGLVDEVVDPSEILNRKELVLMNFADERLSKSLVNKINKQNQFKMTEDDKGFLSTLKNDISEIFNSKKDENAKTEVDAIKADVEAKFTAMSEANEASIEETNTAHKAELDALNAEIEKLTNESSEVEGDDTAEVVEEVILEASKLSVSEEYLRGKFAATLNLFKK